MKLETKTIRISKNLHSAVKRMVLDKGLKLEAWCERAIREIYHRDNSVAGKASK